MTLFMKKKTLMGNIGAAVMVTKRVTACLVILSDSNKTRTAYITNMIMLYIRTQTNMTQKYHVQTHVASMYPVCTSTYMNVNYNILQYYNMYKQAFI